MVTLPGLVKQVLPCDPSVGPDSTSVTKGTPWEQQESL